MKPKDPSVRVGVTLTVFTVLLFVLVFSLDSTLSWWTGRRTCRVYFENVQGLRPSDPVQFHGIPCGRVVDVRIATPDSLPLLPGTAYAEAPLGEGPDSGLRVALTLEIPSDIHAHLRTGSRAHIEKTLTGVTVVNIEQGDGPPLGADGCLVGESGVSLDEVTAELRTSAGQLNRILAEVEPLVRGIRQQGLVVSALRSLDRAGQEAGALAASLRDVVEENRDGIRRSLELTSDFMDDLDASGPSLAALVEETRCAASQAKGVVGALGNWLAQSRTSVDATLENVAGASHNLKSLSAELRRRPWRLLHSPSEAEARELDLYDSATAYSEGALEMRRAIDRLRSLLEHPDPETGVPRDQLTGALEDLEARASRHAAFQEEFWRRLRQLYE